VSPLDHLRATRAETLRFVEALPDEVLTAWPDPEFSPICWHLGHVAFTEAHWTLARCLGDLSLSAPFAARFAQDGCAKSERAKGHSRDALFGYLREVRAELEARWERLDPEHALMKDDFLPWFLAMHEHQHRETMALVLGMARERDARGLGLEDAFTELADAAPLEALATDDDDRFFELSGGEVVLGTDSRLAYDNERPPMPVVLDAFAVATHPVTSGAWASFMLAGGYEERALWSEAGWAWRDGVAAPRGWAVAEGRVVRVRLDGIAPVDPEEPVCGVSFFEATAFARWRGARLPSEGEWEHAAKTLGAHDPVWSLRTTGPMPVREGATDLLGNVWEWTSSTFARRPGFVAFPYRGYSEPYFDGAHRVMRGGSFATHPAIARPSFRNWYVPETRQCFVGLRLAR